MTPNDLVSWTSFLSSTGGWGISVILSGVVVFLWRRSEKHRDIYENKLFELLKQQTETLTEVKSLSARVIELMGKINDKL